MMSPTIVDACGTAAQSTPLISGSTASAPEGLTSPLINPPGLVVGGVSLKLLLLGSSNFLYELAVGVFTFVEELFQLRLILELVLSLEEMAGDSLVMPLKSESFKMMPPSISFLGCACFVYTSNKVTGDTQHAEILKKFRQISGELTVSLSDDIILRGTRIVIPASLEQRVLQLAHEGHQGIIKTKTLLRSKVWFPNIGQKAESIVKNCLARQANTLVTQSEPLRMSELPEAPWHICADFYNKRTPPYNSEPYTVSEVKGSMVTATKDGQSITRNSSFSKKINAETQDVQTDLDDLVNDTVVVATPRYPSRIYRQLPSHLKYYE
ncbi:hypothetical protein N1851_017148 [Merluccius polli]|uniref:Gypsy retrotransposon integrase-like protein 1 n=1 Tax=Merluccius polli TaxID=89951 RepID=A0AA47P2H7_MERPO|nr:hypothetical protein N1851_017148 [Merluccius polli]